MAKSLFPGLRLVGLCIVLLIAIPFASRALAVDPSKMLDLSQEGRYWKELQEKQLQEQLLERQRQEKIREEALNTLAETTEEGAATGRQIIESEIGPPVPVKPSWLETHGQYVSLGLLCALTGVLTVCTLKRHKHEAEIRALSGGYLSDGTAVVDFKMPAFFETPQTNLQPSPVVTPKVDFVVETPTVEAAPVETAVTEFFAQAPNALAEIRKVLDELDRASDEAQRKNSTVQLRDLVGALTTKATDQWALRPAWQMTSALELLLGRLAEKGKDATPSTFHTISLAVDILGTLCKPGVRPDLIISPPISVLAVDDDPLCLRAVVFSLQKASMTPDVAGDGERSVVLCTEKYYDVVFMDIQMPGINGLTACEQIHKTKKNETTPVVFVTVQSDFKTRTESILKGGDDLMAKPFLMFEITVKALTLAMRKRLDLAASCQREVTVKLMADAEKPSMEPVLAA